MSHRYTEVLIVGGSLVGLSAALFLRWHGVDVILAERHPGTSIHPRTPGYNARTMELFRAAGVEKAVRAAGPWRLTGSGLLWAESLTSRNHRWLERPGTRQDLSAISPCQDVMLSQDVLEPVLREHARALGADLRFGTELRAYDDGPDGVTAVLAERATGTRTMVHADYLIAADGADSNIRHKLGIGRSGVGVLEHVAGIMVRADLGDALRDRSFAICQVNNPGFSGMVRVIGDTMALHVPYDPAVGPGQFTAARCVELARAAAGMPGLVVEPLEVLPWQSTALVADGFADGRVFLAGDAAHVMPPAGAYGANTGIQDAANLAWKLAYVLSGWAEPSLLETYDTERRPVAALTVDQALATGRDWFGARLPAEVAQIELVDEVSVKFGYRYDGAGFEDPRHPSGDPGARAPHLWLERQGRRVSTVDLWAGGLTLLAGPEGAAWTEAAARVAGPPLKSYQVADGIAHPGSALLGDPERRWTAAFGATASGAVLIRPDGFIAWRATESAGSRTDAVLGEALRAVLRGQAGKSLARESR